MHRLIFLVTAGALMALADIPVSLWPQVAIGPPGTNNTQRTEVVPGVTPVPGGGVAGVPVPGQPQPAASQAPGRVAPAGGGASGGRIAGQAPNITGGPAKSDGAKCDVQLTAPSATVGHNGGTVEVAIAPLPAHCNPALGASGIWLQLVSNGSGRNVYRFSAAPNTTPLPRTARIIIGDQVFVVNQAGMIQARLAAAPARLVIGLSPKYEESTRRITLWTDAAGANPAATTAAPWLRLQPTRSRKPGRQTYDVIVDNSKLPAGEQFESAIMVTAEGAAPLSVPVVVERVSSK